MNYTTVISVEAIYGTPYPAIPEGYEQVGFDMVSADEEYLAVDKPNAVHHRNQNPVSRPAGPRIILRKAKKYQFVFREYGFIQAGEWGVSCSDVSPYRQPQITQAGIPWHGWTMIFDRVEVKE